MMRVKSSAAPSLAMITSTAVVAALVTIIYLVVAAEWGLNDEKNFYNPYGRRHWCGGGLGHGRCFGGGAGPGGGVGGGAA